MTLQIVSLAARDGGDVSVTFEIVSGAHSQTESFLISAAMVVDLNLRRGECDTECYDAVSRGAEVYRAVKRGVGLLSYGSSSGKSLLRKLIAKGVEREIAEAALEEICARGYLNEESEAKREAERCLTKGWGARRIACALRSKGYDDQTVKAALAYLEDEGVDFVACCAERIHRQGGVVPSTPAEKQKLYASLARYGFSPSEIREALRLLKEES